MTWPVVPLAEVALSVRNGIFAGRPTDEPTGSRILRISAVRAGRVDLNESRFIEGLEAHRIAQFSIDEDDLLVTRYNGSRALVGTAGLVPPHGGTLLHPDKLIRVVLDRTRANARFVNYQFQSPRVRTHLEPRIRTTAGQSGISGGDVRSIPLVLPSLDVQHRVVDLLEDHLSRLDAATEGLVKAYRRLVSLERSALDRYFSADASVPLDDLIVDISAGKSFGSTNAPARDDEWGIIKVSAMTWGEFKPDENKAVPADRVDPRFEIREGDLLVSRANTSEYVGASVLVGPVRPRLLLSDKSLRITPNDRVRPDWLWRALQAPSARRQISALATGTKDSMRNVSQSSVRRILLPKVSMANQAQALSAFAEVKTSSDRLRREVAAQQSRVIGLRRSLLAAAYSGRLSDDAAAMTAVEGMIGA